MTGMTGHLDPNLDPDPNPDLDWARDLFGRARGAGEPAWTADPATLARAGDRRRRIRAASAGGALAGVVALTAAVAVGLGAGTTDLASQAGPGGAWGSRPLSDVFKYSAYRGLVDKSGHAYVQVQAVTDLAVVLGRLDPAMTHLAVGNGFAPRIVAAGDARAGQFKAFAASSVWTDDSPHQSGELLFGFASSAAWARTEPVGAGLPNGPVDEPCDIPVGTAVSISGSTPQAQLKWSSCTVSHQPDGSVVGTASAPVGTGTAFVAVRQFADGEVFSIVAENFSTATLWSGGAPDPGTVLQPTPWSEQSLGAALADPAVRSGWHPIPPPAPAGMLLQPADLGAGWVFDADQLDSSPAAQFEIVNGCPGDRNANLAKPGSSAYYWGSLPNGASGTGYEAEYPLIPGTGAQTMARARAAAQGGCASGPIDYSKDTVIPLPSGIGDDAFAAAEPAQGAVAVDVRVGDTILRTVLINRNHVRDQSWTHTKPLDLTSPADQQWLAGIARSMAARYTADPGSR